MTTAAARRHFLRQAFSAVAASALMRPVEGQEDRKSSGAAPLHLKVVKEFRDARFLEFSANSRMICLYFTKHPHITFTLPDRGQGTYDGGSQRNAALVVIEMGSWRELFSARLRGQPVSVGFFGGSESLFTEASVFPPDFGTVQDVLVDLANGHMEERLRAFKSGKRSTSYSDLEEGTLLGIESGSMPFRNYALTRVTLPDFQETAKVTYAVPAGAEPDGHESAVWFSNDRKTFVYAFGHTLVCRRAEDLGVLWTRQIEPDFWGAGRITIAPDGAQIAVAVVDTTISDQQRRFYVGIYGSQDGVPIVKLALNGDEGLSLSPGGRLLALGRRSRDKRSGDVQLSIEIYDVASRRQVGSIVHDRVPPGRFQSLDAHVGSEFTADGKYLITAGYKSVKVWEFE